jgi:phasin
MSKTTEFPKIEMPGFPSFDMAKMDMSSMDMPAAMREFVEKGVAQSKDNYDKVKTFAEEATATMEKTFETSAKNTTDINKMILGNAKTNFNAALDHAEKLLGVKTLAEAIELQAEFARGQYDAMTAQTKAFQTKITKVTEASVKPVAEKITEVVEDMKAA